MKNKTGREFIDYLKDIHYTIEEYLINKKPIELSEYLFNFDTNSDINEIQVCLVILSGCTIYETVNYHRERLTKIFKHKMDEITKQK